MRIKRIKEKADIFTSAFSNNTQSSERTDDGTVSFPFFYVN